MIAASADGDLVLGEARLVLAGVETVERTCSNFREDGLRPGPVANDNEVRVVRLVPLRAEREGEQERSKQDAAVHVGNSGSKTLTGGSPGEKRGLG